MNYIKKSCIILLFFNFFNIDFVQSLPAAAGHSCWKLWNHQGKHQINGPATGIQNALEYCYIINKNIFFSGIFFFL